MCRSSFGSVFNNEDEQESIQRESFAREILEMPEGNRVVAILGRVSKRTTRT